MNIFTFNIICIYIYIIINNYILLGGNTKDLGVIDGVSMWQSFLNNKPSPRKQILHNIDDITGYAAIRDSHFKYVKGKYIIYIWFYRNIFINLKRKK